MYGYRYEKIDVGHHWGLKADTLYEAAQSPGQLKNFWKNCGKEWELKPSIKRPRPPSGRPNENSSIVVTSITRSSSAWSRSLEYGEGKFSPRLKVRPIDCQSGQIFKRFLRASLSLIL